MSDEMFRPRGTFANWVSRDATAPLYPDGQWKRMELLLVGRCRGETRFLELVSLGGNPPSSVTEPLGMAARPSELFALAWQFLNLGFRAIALRATASRGTRFPRKS